MSADSEIHVLKPDSYLNNDNHTEKASSKEKSPIIYNGKIVQVECKVRARIPYPGGQFYLQLYHNNIDSKEHLVYVFGEHIKSKSLNSKKQDETEIQRKIRGADIEHNSAPLPSKNQNVIPLVRIHSECYTGETVSSTRCDCGYQLAEAMRLMSIANNGVVIYLRQEGRNIGLMEKLKAYNLQDMGHDTVNANLLLNHPADGRSYEIAQAILDDLEINEINILTNNPDKIEKITLNSNITVANRIPMVPSWWLNKDTADHMETPHGLVHNPMINYDQIGDQVSSSSSSTTFVHEHTSNGTSSKEYNEYLGYEKDNLPGDINKTLSEPPSLFSSEHNLLDLNKPSSSSYERHIRPTRPTMTEADKYLLTKALKMGHMLDIPKF
ncbi:hypothetical protein BB558_001421 [Smittium angustum]|uniref:GTP cyclohydrolase II n=1 Tax=Smittium angustum TaxID=133377 RepID=A0A2U1IZQ8_SMIAN|nr:hypothetical protein BB558_005690 [Smittium angustum]PWA02443.1 hypothetical protein BB558_001421 [Smittium angustum]